MEANTFADHIMKYNLTRQEALVYYSLLAEGKMTGYEMAKSTGISRSNAYTALASLAEKGAAYVEEGNVKKYTSVPVEEFCDNYIESLQVEKKWLLEHAPSKKLEEEGYITIETEKHIVNKIRKLIDQAEERVYISCTADRILAYADSLQRLGVSGKKVVVITDKEVELSDATIYLTSDKGKQFGIIADSKYVMTGEYGEGSMNTCLYSGQKNFVELFKTALSNEIKLIGFTKGEN